MWIVFNRQDAPDCGWAVESEAEAIKQCKENEELTYINSCVLCVGGAYEEG